MTTTSSLAGGEKRSASTLATTRFAYDFVSATGQKKRRRRESCCDDGPACPECEPRRVLATCGANATSFCAMLATSKDNSAFDAASASRLVSMRVVRAHLVHALGQF